MMRIGVDGMQRFVELDRIPESIRINSIGFLRFFLASLVIISHSFPLGHFGPEYLTASDPFVTWGYLAVGGFFFLSGFLITASYLGSASLWRFLWHRCLRIFPAFWCCLLVTAGVFAPIASWKENGRVPFSLFSNSDGSLAYVMHNWFLAMQQYPIHDLLRHNPFPSAFDGSLWTLAEEFECYLAVAVLGALGLFRIARPIAWALLIPTSMCFDYAVGIIFHGVPVTPAGAVEFERAQFSVLGYMPVFFAIGSVAYLYRRSIPLHPSLFVLAAAATVAGLDLQWNFTLLPIAASYCLLWLTFRLPIRHFDSRGDFSYGVYIYAFPVQQLLALFTLNRFGYVFYCASTVALTLPLAGLSWYIIEKPSLSLKRWTPSSLGGPRTSKHLDVA